VETSKPHKGLQDERRRRKRLHHFDKFPEVFNNSNVFLSAKQYCYCIILLYPNIIIITINDLLVRHVSIFIDHLQVIVNDKEVFACNYISAVSVVVMLACKQHKQMTTSIRFTIS
jgi:hypothetical protein